MKNNKLAFALILLVSIAGCGGRKKAQTQTKTPQKEVFSEVDIPVAGDSVRSFFDEDVQEFTYAPDQIDLIDSSDLTWQELSSQAQEFKTVYFDFDSDRIRADQEQSLAYDIELVKKKIQNRNDEQPITIVIEGHSCHSAGSSVYNLALSERRAKQLKDRFVAAGVAPENIKIVGRGQEIPAIVNGRPVEGDRQAQWPNRRDEIRIIYA